jgi:hypothetical protein
MTRQQNFHKNPHTARFLQTFHSGIGSNGRNYRQEMGVDTTEERSATEFVGGTFGRDYSTTSTEFFHHLGYKVRIGAGLVTQAQAKWIIDIAEKSEGVTDAMVKSLSTRLEQGFARASASEFITRYKDLPRKAVTAATAEAIAPGASTEEIVNAEVRAGRYALRTEDGVKFYRLDRPTQGRWAGFTFLKVQASDDLHPIKNHTEKARIIAEIAKDVLAAEQLYGRELGHCSRCGRTLTDETSRAYGIGPDCRAKY